MLLTNNTSCNLVSKYNFPKSDCNCELVGFRCLEKLGLKIHFLFREPECDPAPALMISRQKIGLLVIVSRYGSTSTGYRKCPPNSLFNLVALIQRFIREEHQ